MEVKPIKSGNMNLKIIHDNGDSEQYFAHNLVTDAFSPDFKADRNVIADSVIRLGTGSTEPLVTDTQLDSPIDYIVPDESNYSENFSFTGDQSTGFAEITYEKTVKYMPGNIIAFIGEAGLENTDHLITRLLLRDEGGNPIVVEVTETDILEVIYTFKIKWPRTATTQVVNINGTDYTVDIQTFVPVENVRTGHDIIGKIFSTGINYLDTNDWEYANDNDTPAGVIATQSVTPDDVNDIHHIEWSRTVDLLDATTLPSIGIAKMSKIAVSGSYHWFTFMLVYYNFTPNISISDLQQFEASGTFDLQLS